MPIKLIAIDMDGTLLNENNQLNPAVAEAVRAVRATGVRVVLASGRPLPGVMSFLPQLNLVSKDDYAIPYNGALVQNTATGAVLIRHTLSYADYLKIYALAATLGVTMAAEDEEAMYTDAPEVGATIMHEALSTSMPLRFRSPLQLNRTSEFSKFFFAGTKAELDAAEKQLPEAVRKSFYVVRSEDYLLEFLNPAVSKGAALKELAARLDIPASEVMCLGDSNNDISMFEFAGTGIAMGNANAAVKALAKAETGTNAEDGVAQALHKYVLED
ncbi:sugar-phosphatase [Lacticaseibacillus zhaodongensis]|uniref:sugar-phosphatase n=1 Tax=Lacticaseibacillus zhaodongensis TaxID=2668065 RepID=UPI0012D2A149|nr:sugar-phosphatase [Lacticaseibacillus zhaodongensis]